MKKMIILMFLSFHTCFAQSSVQQAVDSLKQITDKSELCDKLDALAKGTERDLDILIDYYYIKDNPKVDSLKQVAILRFPTGRIAFNKTWNVMMTIKPAVEQENEINDLRHRFDAQHLEVPISSAAIQFAKEKNTDKAIDYYLQLKENYIKQTTAGLLVKVLDSNELSKFEKIVQSDINALKKAPNEGSIYYGFLDVYANLLIKRGRYKEALPYSKLAFDNLPKRDELSRNYYYLLSKTGKYSDAIAFLEASVRSGFADEEIKAELRIAYAKLHPSKDLSVYMKSLRLDLRAELMDKIRAMEIKENVVNFNLKDTSDKEVSLSDFQGKIVVIDLWATWCGPCVAALPAMQEVVEQYRDDQEVAFLFVNTLEKGTKVRERAMDFFKKNNYQMDLYIDEINLATNSSDAYDALGKGGIPRKVVIDRQGKIRFKTAGFSGGRDDLVEELSIMIELAKEEI
ncbi:redoxin domain-containing protein [Sphingobacterium sp. DK4209]|uniref:Redoxin domain-containing protein n=1 Tax=Sphingobacterium zhuxiongii TaxID=2662364 RepID=A0A5Q0QGN4_9SPHI|nr:MULTISPECIES: TlpA disulfide reductase family protein [unclassified Sphingobacterium]MVZ65343.1 redoxin domain-containing protein [Sphingobacterium sp. DK4209]QGA26430.1 redoxin domain-containing protein [Sphingobacterium sp. dk4302]